MDFDTLIQRLVDDRDAWNLYPNPSHSAALHLWRNMADSMVDGDDCYVDGFDRLYTQDEFEFLFQRLYKMFEED